MNRWNQHTLFRLLIFYILGILLQLNLSQHITFHYGIIVILFVLLIILQYLTSKFKIYGLRWLPGIVLAFIMVSIGFEFSRMHDKRNHPLHLSNFYFGTEPLLVKIKWQPESRPNSYKVTAEILAVEADSVWIRTTGNALLYFPKDSVSARIAYGDKLLVYAALREPSPPGNPHEFDYRRFLHLKNIQYQGYIRASEWVTIENGTGNPLVKFAFRLREIFINVFENQGISGRDFAVAMALVLGMDDYLDNDTRKEFSSAGAMHVLCVSGLHVGVIFLVLNSMLFFISRNRYARLLRCIILLAGIWFYALLTGLAPSVLRAATMFSFVIIGTGIQRKATIYNSLTVSAFLLLIINPFLVYDVGFQLSYTAVIAIVTIQPRISQLWRPKNLVADKIWGITSVSVAAQLGTAPLGLYYFHQFPNYFIITNLIVIPLATIILYAGFLTVILSFIPLLADWVSWFLAFMLKAMNYSVAFIDNLPYSATTGIFINLAEMMILIIIIVAVFRALTQRKAIYLHLALLFFIVFTASGIYKQLERISQRRLTVYAISRNAVIDLIAGRNSILLADSLILKDPAAIEFQVSAHHVRKGINRTGIISFDECLFSEKTLPDNLPFKIHCPLIQFNERYVVLVDNNLPVQSDIFPVKVDLLVIIDNHRDPESVLKSYLCNQVVVSDKVAPWVVDKWKEKCLESGISCYVVREKGAFVWDLK